MKHQKRVMQNTSLSEGRVPAGFPKFHPEILWCMVPLISVINSAVIITILRFPKLRITANYFVFAMACCDLFTGCILLPFLLTKESSHAIGGLVVFTLVTSLGFSCMCTYDRFVAVIWSLRYRELMPKKKAVTLIACVCFGSTLLAIIPQGWVHNVQYKQLKAHRAYIGCIVSLILTATVAEIFVYIVILKIAKGHATQMRALAKKAAHFSQRVSSRCAGDKKNCHNNNLKDMVNTIRLCKSFMLVSITFFLFWFPVGYINIVDDVMMRPDLMPMWLHQLSFYSTFISCLVHPMLYGMFQKQLRRAMCSFRPKQRKMSDSRPPTSCDSQSLSVSTQGRQSIVRYTPALQRSNVHTIK